MVRWSLAALLFLAPLLSGCTDFSSEGDNVLIVRGIDLSAPEVGSGHLVLAVNLTLDNLESSSGPLKLVAKAYDGSTGLLVQTATTEVPSIAKDRTKNVELRLELPRAAAYRLEVEVYQDERLVQVASVQAGNLDHLEPNTHDTGLRVAQLDFEVVSTAGNRTGVRTSVYLTNEGKSDSRPLSLQLKAREVSTSLLADEVWASVGSIGRDETQVYNGSLSLPDGFNYEVEAVLWDGQVIVERGSGFVQFAPRTTVTPGQGIVVSTPDLGAFDRGDAYGAGDGGSENASPGPGLFVILGVLALAAVVARRSLR
jgi:hypothetical protein